jgi:ferrous iron transport protein B
MSCSARLPVYTLLIAAFIPDVRILGGLLGLQGLTMLGLYLLGIVTAVLVALVLKRTLLRGETPPFVLELPAYKWPSAVLVMRRMLQGGWAFVHGAGTLIVAVTVLVWAAGYYPRVTRHLDPALVTARDSLQARVERLTAGPPAELEHLHDQLAEIDHQIQAARLRGSYLGRAGQWIEPVVRPLGWDWRIGCAVLASFPAREVVVSTLGVIYKLGADQDESSEGLRQALTAATWEGTRRPVFTIPVALSVMVFFALCAQCASTLAVMKRETSSWRWPIFTFLYMTGLAYVAALATYQIGTRYLT